MTLTSSDTKSFYSLTSCRARYGPHESWRLLKNLVVLGLAFVTLFSAFLATANLQSSINAENGLGNYSLASAYVSLTISSLFLPALLIHKLGTKSTLVLTVSGFLTYVSAQFYPTLLTLVPAGAFLGGCSAVLWVGSSAYVSRIAGEYAHLIGASPRSTSQRFFGIFFLFYHSSQIWGNLISASVLSVRVPVAEEGAVSPPETAQACGARFCPAAPAAAAALNPDSTNSTHTHDSFPGHLDAGRSNVLFGIYAGLSLSSAAVLLFFLDPASRYGELDCANKPEPDTLQLLMATVRHWRQPTQLLIIPLSVWTGMQEAFLSAVFTAAFISCAWGLEYIGLIMLCYGIHASLFSVLIGCITNRIGRPFMFCTAGLLNFACLLVMLYWNPTAESSSSSTSPSFVIYIIAGVWGVAEAVWSPQLEALYADIFPESPDAAFSNSGVWISVGFILVYCLAEQICVQNLIYGCMFLIGLALSFYACIEVLERRKAEAVLSPV